MPLNSGLKLDDEAVTLFNDMKLGKKVTRFISLKLNDDSTRVLVEKVVKKTTDQKEDYATLMKHLSDADGRFIILDLEVVKPNGSTSGKLYCIMWNPDVSGAKTKMLYAAALGCVVNTLKMDAGAVTIQANDFDDISYETLMAKGQK